MWKPEGWLRDALATKSPGRSEWQTGLTRAFTTTCGDLQLTNVAFYKFVVIVKSQMASHVEVIKPGSQALSEISRSRTTITGGFPSGITKYPHRTGNKCMWTGLPPGVGMHIIPWSTGDEVRLL